ncbi:hypothetical protein GE21DRAFT_1087209 [Neurospora crassa]|nr:hypothetical protein GE21DRAFT_1087209 [Neurospora crassa]
MHIAIPISQERNRLISRRKKRRFHCFHGLQCGAPFDVEWRNWRQSSGAPSVADEQANTSPHTVRKSKRSACKRAIYTIMARHPRHLFPVETTGCSLASLGDWLLKASRLCLTLQRSENGTSHSHLIVSQGTQHPFALLVMSQGPNMFGQFVGRSSNVEARLPSIPAAGRPFGLGIKDRRPETLDHPLTPRNNGLV